MRQSAFDYCVYTGRLFSKGFSSHRKLGFLFLLLFFFQITFGQVTANFSASKLQGCSPLVVCFTDLSTGNPTSWLWNFGNGNLSPDRNPCAIYIVPGTYTVSLTVSNGGSSDTKTVTNMITVFQDPTANFSTSDTVGCRPKTISFTDMSTPGDAPIVSWFWDFGDGQTSAQQNPSNTYTNPGIYTVILLVQDANGCTHEYSADDLIRILPSPTADFSAAPTFSCSYPAIINFTNSSSTNGATTYFWEFGDGATSNQQNPSHTYVGAGLYTVKLTVSDASGCSNTKIRPDYLVIDDLAADFAPDKTSGCGSFDVNFTDLTSTVSVITNWHWDFGDGGTSSVQNTTHNYNTPGTYTVSLIVTNNKGCKDTVIYPNLITVNPGPTADFTADNTQGCAIPFVVNFTELATGEDTYLWDFGDGNTSTSANPTHNYMAPGSYGVRLTVTSAGGCTKTKFRPNYIKITNPTANFTSDVTQGCVDVAVSFSDISNTVQPVVSWHWDFGDGGTSTAQNPSHVYTSQGQYDVTLIITNSDGCQDSLTVPQYFKAGDTPVANFGASQVAACLNDVISFYDSSNVGDEWWWDFGDGSTSTQQNPTHQFGDTGTFDITLVIFNFGCTDTLIIPDYISISPPKAQFSVDYSCINPYDVVITDNSIGPNIWSWNFGDGDTSNTQNNTHTFDTTGNFLVTLYVQDTVSGCIDSTAQTLSVTDPVAGFSGAPLSGCAPLIVYFTSGSVDASTYSWDFGDGGTSTQQDPIYTYNSPGTYDVTLIITDIHGCTDTVVKPNYVTVYGVAALFAADTLFGCTPLTVNYVDSSSSYLGNVNSWYWDFGDGDTSTQQQPSKIYTQPGIYTVSLFVTDDNGCADSLTRVNYIVPTYPRPDFYANDTMVCVGEEVIFNNYSIGTGMSYTWDFGDGGTSILDTPSHAYSSEGVYTVSLTALDINGCDSTIIKPLYIRVVQPHADLFADSLRASCPPLLVNFDDMTPPADSITDWLWYFGDGQTSDLQNPSHVYITPDTFWAHMEVTDYNGCKDTAYLPDPIIVSGPQGTFDFIQDEYCIDVPVQFFSNAADTVIHVYDFGDGNVGVYMGGDTITYNYTYVGVFNPSLILDDGHGCVISIDHPDSVTTYTVVSDFTSDISYICHSSIVQFFDLSSGYPLADSWFWDFGDGATSTLQNPTHYYGTPGSYDVMLVVTNSIGCMDTIFKPKYITVDLGPAAAFNADSIGCVPFTVDFTDMSVSDSTIVSWSWDFGDGNTSILQNPTNTFTTADTFTVMLIIETVSGCLDTVTKPIMVNPIPTAEAGPDDQICYGDSTQLNGSGGITFTWSPATTLNDSTISNPVASPLSNTTYYLTVTDANGCTNIDSVNININPLPVLGTPDTNICIGESFQLDISGGVSYSWSPDSTLDDPFISNPTATPLATTTYTVTVTDVNGCINTTDMILTVNPLPVPDITTTGTDICEGQDVQLNATGGISYSWTPASGLSDPNISNPVANPWISTKYLVTVTDSNGCVNTDSVQLNVSPMPVTTISPDVAICINDSTQLSATGGALYSWYPTVGLTCTTCADPIATPVTTTTYYVDITNALGCTVTDSVTVTVHPLPVPGVTSNTPICKGSSIQLNASGGISYNWTPASYLSCTNCPNPVATPIATLTYSVEVTSAFGCVNYDSVLVTVNHTKSIMQISDSVACVPATIQFTDNSVTGATIVEWHWSFGDGATDTVQDPQHTYTIAGNYIATLSVLSSNGCTDSTSIPVVIHGLPTANAGPDVTICSGDTVQFSATGGIAYQWNPASNLSNDTIANPLAYPINTTLYDLVVTDINGCKDRDSLEVTVNPLPMVTVTSDANNTCAFKPVQLNATGGITYSWTPVTRLSDPNIPDPVATPILPTTYTVLVTDSNGCQNTGSIAANVYPLPLANVSPDTAICFGNSVELSASGGSTYLWSPDSSLSCNDCDTPIATPDSTTTYEVDVINSYGCVTTAYITVTVMPLPNIVTTKDTFICDGQSIQLNASGGATYQWSPAFGLNDANVPNPVASPDSSTTYTVEVTTGFGCVDYDTISINVYRFLAKMALSKTEGCLPVDIQFNDNSASNDSIVSWNWNFGDGVTSITQDPYHVYDSAGVFNVKLVLTSFRGCSDSITKPVIVHDLPVAGAGPDTTICDGVAVQINGTGGGNYSWSPSLWLSDDDIANPVAQPHSTLEYILVVTDSNGCQDADSIMIHVNPLPQTTISAGASLCLGQSSVLTATGGVHYSWTPSAGLSDSTISNPTATPASTTMYTVEVTNQYGCLAWDSVLLSVFPVPNIQVKARGDMCKGDEVNIDVSGASVYQWIPSTGLSCDDCPEPVASPDTTTTYYLTMTDAYNCHWYDTIPINVWPLPTVETTGDKIICKGEDIALATVATEATMFNWSPAVSLNDDHVLSPVATPQQTTEYRVTAITPHGCADMDTVVIEVIDKVIATVSDDASICLGSSVELEANIELASSSGYNVLWLPAEYFNDPTALTQTVSPISSTTYTLVAYSSTCGADTQTVLIHVNPLPTVDAGQSVEVMTGTEVTFTATSPQIIDSYSWTPGEDLDCDFCQHVSLIATESGTYTVNVLDENGCPAADSVHVRVVTDCSGEIWVPNAFTPNSDETNDLFRVRATGLIELEYFRVWDRWGNLVFETENKEEGWNGVYKDKTVNPAVFVWLVRASCPDGQIVEKKGNVTAIR